MPEAMSPAADTPLPDFETLVRFLVNPFLESPEALKLDCETFPQRSRVWIRMAFEGADKGRVFGRGGRNIQAIRTVLTAIAQMSGYSVHLDVFGSATGTGGNEGEEESDRPPRRPPPNRRPVPRPSR